MERDAERLQTGGKSRLRRAGFILAVSLEIAVIGFIAFLIGRTLIPKGYWQSLELQRNLAKWRARDISHYQMSFSIVCLCPFEARMPLEVEVKNGALVSVTDAQGVPVAAVNEFHWAYPELMSIDGLFRYAARSMQQDIVTSATYDPDLGYPLRVWLDPNPQIIDEETGFWVENLRALPP